MRFGRTENVVMVAGSIFSYLTTLGDSHLKEIDLSSAVQRTSRNPITSFKNFPVSSGEELGNF